MRYPSKRYLLGKELTFKRKMKTTHAQGSVSHGFSLEISMKIKLMLLLSSSTILLFCCCFFQIQLQTSSHSKAIAVAI